MGVIGQSRKKTSLHFPASFNDYGNISSPGTSFGSVKIPGNKILTSPWSDKNIYQFDANTNTVSNVGNLINGLHYGGILTPQNKVIYFLAGAGTAFFKEYDIVSQTVISHGNISALGGVLGACLHSDGFIYCIGAQNSDTIVRINPIDNTYLDIASTGFSAQGRYSTMISAHNGLIYLTPLSGNVITEFDPISSTVNSYSITPSGNGYYYGGQLLPNGNILCVPRQSNKIAIFDVVNKVFNYYGNITPLGANKHFRCSLFKSGRVAMAPVDTDKFVIFDSVTNRIFESESIQPNLTSYIGGSTDDQGRVVFMPHNKNTVKTLTDNSTVNLLGDENLIPNDLSQLAASNFNKYYNNF